MSSEFDNLVKPPLPHETFAKKPTWDDIRAYNRALISLQEQIESSEPSSPEEEEEKDKEIIQLRTEVARLTKIVEQAREQVARLQEHNKRAISEKEELRRQLANANAFASPAFKDWNDPEEDEAWKDLEDEKEFRKVSKEGKISFQKKKYSVGKEWKGQQVEITHANGTLSVQLPDGKITEIKVKS